MKKIAFFAFKGEQMCFNHLLLNAIDLVENGHEAKIVIEGQAVKLVETLIEKENPVFKKARDLNIIHSICKLCSEALGAYDYNSKTNIPLIDTMSGHVPMEPFVSKGYEIIVL